MKTNDPRLDLSTALVLSWAAVSTKIQDKYSIEDQLRMEREWCAKHNATMVEELVVRGFSRDYWTLADVVTASAKDPEMEAFAKLQAHIRKKSFTVFLCFDADRFGRTQSLVHEVIGRITRDCNALIYTLFDGVWMDEESAPMIGTMKAYKAQADVTKLREYRVVGMDNRGKDGKSTTAVLPIFHKRVRDEKGVETGVVVNEDLRPLWTDLATCILRGVSWGDMEKVLFHEFGHGLNGKPYHFHYMRQLVLHYAFWGHAAINYRRKGDEGVTKTGPWLWDEHVPAPPPAVVYRNKLPAVYGGIWSELGEAVKAELYRRYALRGKARALHTFRFHGLLVCDECGYTMSRLTTGKKTKRVYIRCETRFGSKQRRDLTCSQSVNVRMEVIQDYLHAQLQQRLDGLQSPIFDHLTEADALERQITDMQRQLARLERKAENLVSEQAEAPENLRAVYRRKVSEVGAEIQRTNDAIDGLQAELANQDTSREAQLLFFDMLRKNGVAWLWQQPETFIHQGLCAALGDRQLVIRDGVIIGVAPLRRRRLPARRPLE